MFKRIILGVFNMLPDRSISYLSRVGFKLMNANAIRCYEQSLLHAPAFGKREALWDHIVAKIGKSTLVDFYEFGVWEGKSIRHFSNGFTNTESRFVGFDSFEGLPSDWERMWSKTKKGTFSTDGAVPVIDDTRISFEKGWFNETIPDYVNRNRIDDDRVKIIHIDADLYESTLMILMLFAIRLEKFHFICDEWPGGEALAIQQFGEWFGYEIEMLGSTHDTTRKRPPDQVWGKAVKKQTADQE